MKLNITVQDQLQNITCPTLIVQGREDFIVTEAAELAHQLIRGSKLAFIDKSGHYPYMENKVEFFETMHMFLNEIQL